MFTKVVETSWRKIGKLRNLRIPSNLTNTKKNQKFNRIKNSKNIYKYTQEILGVQDNQGNQVISEIQAI